MGVFCGMGVFLILKTVTYECGKSYRILPLTKKNASHKLCDSTFFLLQRQKNRFTAGTELVFSNFGEILNCIYRKER